MSNTTCTIDEKKSDTKANDQRLPTIRIQAELFEPTKNRYPVFNYQRLLSDEIKRRKKDQQSNSFEEIDESLKQLADHFEQKYASKKKIKKKKTSFYNYSELAAGYDENDSFIDNTEIFDEVVPEEVETKHGGYYVNVGSLEFKKVNYISKDSDEIKSSQPRKNFINTVLEDSDEKLPTFAVSNNSEKNSLAETKTSETSTDSSSSSDKEKESSKPTCQSLTPIANGKVKRKQSNDSDSAGSVVPIKKKKISTVKTLIQEKRIQLPECKPSCSKDNQPISLEEASVSENNVSSYNDTIESVINAACSKPKVLSNSGANVEKSTQKVINPSISTDLPVSNGVHNVVEKLPDIIVEIIESIKTEAQIAIQNNLNIFSEQINLLLLSIVYQKELTKFNEEPIFASLAEYMLCDKEKLVKQVKKLIDSEDVKIAKPIERLKNAIEKIMPSVYEQYSLECSKILGQRTNGTSSDGQKSKPGPKRPRRKFPWNDEFRGYVREIINIRTVTYSKIKRLHPVSSYIEQFINERIKPLWPVGWMKTTVILKELKAKDKDPRPKIPKKQLLQNSPMKIKSAIKLASKHKVSNSAMNKSNKWNKQRPSKMSNLSTGTTTISTSHTSSPMPSTSNLKQNYDSVRPVSTGTLSNDVCPYQATITTTAINGCKKKESEKNSVIIRTEASTGDILDLSPNKPNPISHGYSKRKDITAICINSSQDNNSSAKPDSQVSPKHVVHQPISRKQRLLQELHNTPLPDQQRLSTHISVDQQNTKPKDEKSILPSSKLDCIKVDDNSTAKDMLSQLINESLMDNTSPLPSQFTTNNFSKPREETKTPASVSNMVKQEIKNEYSDWQQNERNVSSKNPSSHQSSSIELAEAQEVIRDLLVLNQMSSSCSSRNTRDNSYNKHSSSLSMYSSHSPDSLVGTPSGVIHHPAYRSSYSTINSINKSRNESARGTSIGIPKMNIGFQDEFLKQMVKTEEPNSHLATDNYQKRGIPTYGLQSNAQSSDNLFSQQYYSSTLNTKSKQDMSHNSITYSNTNE